MLKSWVKRVPLFSGAQRVGASLLNHFISWLELNLTQSAPFSAQNPIRKYAMSRWKKSNGSEMFARIVTFMGRLMFRLLSWACAFLLLPKSRFQNKIRFVILSCYDSSRRSTKTCIGTREGFQPLWWVMNPDQCFATKNRIGQLIEWLYSKL